MINYLIDSENIGTKWISYLDENIEELDKAFLFYTDASKSISCKELSVLFSFIRQLETIHCQNGTANALDFQLVSYLGYLIRMDTKSTYCILSKDKGYDAVVHFWKAKGIHIYRIEESVEKLKLFSIASVSLKSENKKKLPPLGCILSLKAKDPTLKEITSIIKNCSSCFDVQRKLGFSLGEKQGMKYYMLMEKHLKKYYGELT